MNKLFYVDDNDHINQYYEFLFMLIILVLIV